MKVIAVDYDDTLCMASNVPNVDVVKYVSKQFYTRGVIVIVHTARPESYRKLISDWLATHDIPYHAIVCDKLPADVYVDDKAINPTSLEDTENEK